MVRNLKHPIDLKRPRLAGAWLIAAAAMLCGAPGCGEGYVEGQRSVNWLQAELQIDHLAMAPPSLISGDLPGCEADDLGGEIELLRHPTSNKLLVVVVDGDVACVDSAAAIVSTIISGTSQTLGVQRSGHDPSQAESTGVPCGGEVNDDPVPVKGDDSAAGDEIGDDPVPVKDPPPGGGAIGDDPVPV